MAKKVYVGVDGKARNVKKIYVGVEGKARRGKKGYIGVGGIARPFFSSEQKLECYGAIDAMSQARGLMGATTVGNYALFAGGCTTMTDYTTVVDAYNVSLIRSTPTALSQARSPLGATTVGSYALFAGGRCILSSGSTTNHNNVDAYNISLTRSTPTALSQARSLMGATTVGNYALFAGGVSSRSLFSVSYSASVDAYTII